VRSRIRKISSRIQGIKKHRIPDPDPQHCTQHTVCLQGTGYIGIVHLKELLFKNAMHYYIITGLDLIVS
jgi:hypothetical protein